MTNTIYIYIGTWVWNSGWNNWNVLAKRFNRIGDSMLNEQGDVDCQEIMKDEFNPNERTRSIDANTLMFVFSPTCSFFLFLKFIIFIFV